MTKTLTEELQEKAFEKKSQSEEWGAWKFVSDMLDTPHPDPELAKCGIYHTSKCYEQIHDFVVEQKKKAHQAGVDEERKEWLSGNRCVVCGRSNIDSKGLLDVCATCTEEQ